MPKRKIYENDKKWKSPLFLCVFEFCICVLIALTVTRCATAAGQTSGLMSASGTGTILEAAAKGPPTLTGIFV